MKGALWKVGGIENDAKGIKPHLIHYIQTLYMIRFTANIDTILLVLTDFRVNCEMGSFCCLSKSHNVPY